MFNRRLREVRMKRGFTQQRLSEILDIALRSYPCYDLLIKIADTLDVSLDYLLGRDDFMKAHGVSADEYL